MQVFLELFSVYKVYLTLLLNYNKLLKNCILYMGRRQYFKVLPLPSLFHGTKVYKKTETDKQSRLNYVK